MRNLAVITLTLSLVATPAVAGETTSGPATVSVADASWRGYECQTTTARLTMTVGESTPWLVTMQASPQEGRVLNAVVFADIGSNIMTKELLICPADSNGRWTAVVTARLVGESLNFTVPFTVSQLATTTAITQARWKNNVLRVRGSVLTDNGVGGRAVVEVQRLRNGVWRTVGHTAANDNGVFRFLAPRRADQVRVNYLGDTVTLPSQQQSVVTVVRRKDSRT